MNIIITGANGYLGSRIAQLLACTDHNLILIDNLSHGYPYTCIDIQAVIFDNILNMKGGYLGRFIEGLTAENTVVIHLAAVVGEDAYKQDPKQSYRVNVEGTQIACSWGFPVVFASTCSVYGRQDGISDERTIPNPVGGYARSKVEAEQIVLAHKGLVLRQGTLCGMGIGLQSTRLELLPNQIAFRGAAKQDIEIYGARARRPYLSINHAAALFIEQATEKPFPAGELWNIADTNMNKLELVEMAERLLGYPLKVKYAADEDQQDPRDYAVDLTSNHLVGHAPGNIETAMGSVMLATKPQELLKWAQSLALFSRSS